jgi:hypothetical protein
VAALAVLSVPACALRTNPIAAHTTTNKLGTPLRRILFISLPVPFIKLPPQDRRHYSMSNRLGFAIEDDTVSASTNSRPIDNSSDGDIGLSISYN